jgi:hypothetical protein
MEQTTNLKMNKPLISDKYKISIYDENLDVIDANIGNLNAHSSNSTIHVTSEEKEKINYTIITNEQIDSLFE